MLYLLSLSLVKIANRSDQIRRQNEELHKMNASKDKFFSIIAHDLKSPFNAIIGFSDILVKQVNNKNYSAVKQYAEIISQSSNKAMDLLMNLMEWSQSQTGHMKFNPENFDMVGLINEMDHLFIDLANHKSLEMNHKLPKKAVVRGDRAMISTILRNLISNAIKYSKPGGVITISASETANGLVVSVADTGIGIPRYRMENLFQIDGSSSTTGTLNEEGTGLGLILVKEFIQENKGKVWVESEEGKGSTFYVLLPLGEQSQPSTPVR